MHTRKEIEALVSNHVKYEGVKHISDMLEGIEKRIFSVAKDRLFYTEDKYLQSRAGMRMSSFQEYCADEKWEFALGVADSMNKEILGQTPLFQDFVKDIKKSSEYISIVRNMRLDKLL